MSALLSTRRRRRVRAAALPAVLAATAMLAAACTTSGSPAASTPSASAAGNKTLVVRGVAGNTSDPFWTTFMCGATKEAAKLGVNFKWYAGTTPDTTAFQTNFNAALLDHPQGMLVNPFDAGQFAAAAKNLMAKGVPVVSSVPFSPPTQYEAVLTDQDGSGLVPYALKLAGTSGTVATVGGAAGVAVIAQRYQPLLNALKKQRPGLTMLPVQYDNFDPVKAQTILAGDILAHPDLTLIIASTGPEGQGAAAAVAQAGKKGKIKILAFDAVPAELTALKNGTISALAAQPAIEEGTTQVDAVVKYLRAHPAGGPVPTGIAPNKVLSLGVITPANVNSPAVAGYEYSATCNS
jgi:ribose transport system substrate-binding protein